MQVKGNRDFNVSAQRLWGYLMDPVVLAKITPGISALEFIEEDQYKTISNMKIGPVKGLFKGKMSVMDKQEPSAFKIKLEQLSKIGNAHGQIDMSIDSINDSLSSLRFEGKINLSGLVARTGQRVLSGVANSVTKLVFDALEKHIEEDQENQNIIS